MNACAGAIALALVALPSVARAQGATLVGTVRADSIPVTAAEVTIVALRLATRTDESGRYRLSGIAAGRHLIVVRGVGFSVVSESLTFADAEVRHDLAVKRNPTILDTAVTKAAPRIISPGLRGFEERRKMGIGKFLGEEYLRKNEDRQLADVIRQLPGTTLVRSGPRSYAVSSRRQGPPRGAFLGGPGSIPSCYVSIYQDGILLYDQEFRTPLLDLNSLSIRNYAGVEFYAGEASVPVGYRSGKCGTLILWGRER